MCCPELCIQTVKHLKPLTLLGNCDLGLFSLGGCTTEEEMKQEISLKVHLLVIIKRVVSTHVSFISK